MLKLSATAAILLTSVAFVCFTPQAHAGADASGWAWGHPRNMPTYQRAVKHTRHVHRTKVVKHKTHRKEVMRHPPVERVHKPAVPKPNNSPSQVATMPPETETSSNRAAVIAWLRRYIDRNPTGWRRVWCGKALDMALRATGHPPGSALARAYASYGKPAPGPVPGAIGVEPHHVYVVVKAVGHGRVLAISGNDSHRVRERIRSTHRTIAWRLPS